MLSNSLNVHIDICHNYEGKEIKYGKHITKGRDDFYAVYLSYKLRCKVMTDDTMKDYKEGALIPRFLVREKRAFKQPSINVIEPDLMKIKKPRLVNFPIMLH